MLFCQTEELWKEVVMVSTWPAVEY